MTTHYASHDTKNLTGPPVKEATRVWPVGIALTRWDDPGLHQEPRWNGLYGEGRTVEQTISSRLVFAPSWHGVVWGVGLLLWLLLLWAGPAFVGLCTQIRKGLPEFARAPRTIIAAANYESHRLVYVSIFIALCMGVELAVRRTVWFAMPWMVRYAVVVVCLAVAIGAFGAAGWIGPLRSDYTKQLVRSRLHMTRIIIMYAIILPWALTLGIVSLLYRRILW